MDKIFDSVIVIGNMFNLTRKILRAKKVFQNSVEKCDSIKFYFKY